MIDNKLALARVEKFDSHSCSAAMLGAGFNLAFAALWVMPLLGFHGQAGLCIRAQLGMERWKGRGSRPLGFDTCSFRKLAFLETYQEYMSSNLRRINAVLMSSKLGARLEEIGLNLKCLLSSRG